MAKARFEELYTNTIRPGLKKTLNINNDMESPKLSKIVLNVGTGKESVANSKVVDEVVEGLTKIAGQRAVKTYAKKSIAGFKLREGMPLGARVTLRKKRMYEFLDKLVSLALPQVRDFQGIPTKLDRRGNYNLGIKEWTIFPEIEFNVGDKTYGLNISIHTTAKTDAHAFELLKSFGMPFRKA